MIRARTVVIDASAVVAVLFGEPTGNGVIERTNGAVLAAPSLLTYEVASVCDRKLREHPAAQALISRHLADFESLAIATHEPLPHRLVASARETGLTAYDAAYLELALELGAPLVTLDRELDRVWRGRR